MKKKKKVCLQHVEALHLGLKNGFQDGCQFVVAQRPVCSCAGVSSAVLISEQGYLHAVAVCFFLGVYLH